MKLTTKDAEMIRQLYSAGKIALGNILIRAMKQMAGVSAEEIAADDAIRQAAIKKVIEDYTENINHGGSICVERILTPTAGGAIATTKRMFVPWLYDMAEEDAENLLKDIYEMHEGAVHPRDIARAIKDRLDSQKHRYMTAARTEAAKIRNDTRSRMFEEMGYEYVQYISAGDEKVRPEHQLRHGKIYRHADAPYIGEYNCRCALAPADFLVHRRGAQVEESDAVFVPEEMLQ